MIDAPTPLSNSCPPRRRRRHPTAALWPPLVILTACGLILGYRLWRTDWPGLAWPTVSTRSPVAHPTRVSPPPSPPPTPPKVKVTARVRDTPVETVPPPPLAVSTSEPPRVAAQPEPRPEPLPLGLDATPLKPDDFIQPVAPPPVSAQEALEAIAREAATIRAERQEESHRKVEAAAQDQVDTKTRRLAQLRRAARFNEEERYLFHETLGRLLTEPKADQAARLEATCKTRKNGMPPSMRKIYEEARLGRLALLGRRAKVEYLRQRGIPEEVILFELANMELHRVGLRSGLANRGEALMSAARQLLDIPLPARSPAAIANARAAANPGQPAPARP